MYTMVPTEMVAGAMEIICFLFSVAASLVMYVYWLRF